MSSLLSAELAATCNALGYFDNKTNKYYADDNTLESVKDLIRYLRRDDSNHDIRRQLGETKVVQTDLIPLLKNYWEQTELFDVLLRLTVNLTTPALMLWNEDVPIEKHDRNLYIQIEEHLQSYKESFTDEGIWAVLCTKLSKILEIDFVERGDEFSLIIERILILIRNVLYVPANPDEFRPDNDASVHDQVLWALHQSGMLDLLLYISSAATEEAYYMHILEILSFMFKEQSAYELGNAALQRSEMEKLRDEAELLAIRHRETREKRDKIKMYNSVRHSRFGGTFVVKSMKSVGENELILHKPLSKIDALSFDTDKKKPKTPKNRLPIKSYTSERRSAFSIRLFLKEFCIEFLNASYNTMMHQVKMKLDRTGAQKNDESYYFWAMRFFMEFNRSYKFEVKLVSETMSVGSFHYIQKQAVLFFEMISMEKKKLRLWSRRLHLALLAYRELLHTLSDMEKSTEFVVKESTKVIKSNIFYVMEYRELILTLLVMYDELKMSSTYLNDLIETQHIFIRMLQSYCQQDGQFITQKKAKKKHKKKSTGATVPVVQEEEINLENEWDEIASQLSIVIEGSLEMVTNVVPFDATSDVPIDQQRSEAMKNVQRILRGGDLENAVGLLRAAREVWPENDCFGSNNMSPEEEFLALRDIFFADLGLEKPKKSKPNELVEENVNSEDEESYNYDEPTEINFSFSDFQKRLANQKIVKACGIALNNFEKNSPLTNHCIVKLLHRIAWDCKMHGMIFQVSIFRTFQRIFKVKELPQYKELVKFAIFIMRKFIQISEKNPLIYMEALCWKRPTDAIDLEQGYGTHLKSSNAAKQTWTELEEDELKALFMEHQQNNIDEDVVDWISKTLINDTRTRRAIIRKLKEMYLLTDYNKRSKSATGLQQHWSATEETQLKELYEQYENAMDPLGCIMDRLDVRRPKNRIVEKLLVMGLIQDKKQLRKKRSTKMKSNPQENSGEEDSFISGSESEDDINIPLTASSSLQQQTKQRKPPSSKKLKRKKTSKKSVQVSSNELAKLLIEMVEADMINALEWIKECIDDLVDDIENDPDDDDEGVPIVPIMESSVSAMENEKFLYLLRAFGFVEPADEQETYWRIPAQITADALKNYSSMITQAIERKLIIINEEMSKPSTEINDNDDLSARNINESDDELSEEETVTIAPSNNEIVERLENSAEKTVQTKKKTRKIIRVEDSDSDSDNETAAHKENFAETNVDEENLFEGNVGEGNLSEGNAEEENLSDADKEIESVKRNRSLLDSDEEDNRPTNKKQKKFFDSDDDD